MSDISEVEADVAADKAALADINAASVAVANSGLSRQEKAAVHSDLAKESGVLSTEEAADEAYIAADTPVVAPPVTTAPPAPAPTFTAVATSDSAVTVSWANVVPTQLARNGSDSTGGGAWNTGALAKEASSGSYGFTLLIPGDTYVFTLTEASGATMEATVKMPAAPVATAPPVVSPPPVVATPPATGTPVADIAAFAAWTCVFDKEFSSMPTTAPGVIPAGYIISPSSQISGGTQAESVATNVQVVKGQGLILTVSNTRGDGGSIETDPLLLPDGFTATGEFYRRVVATIPPLVNGQVPNQMSSWELYEPGSSPNGGEIDDPVTGWGSDAAGMETGNTSQNAIDGPSYGELTGKHVFSRHFNPATGTVQFYVDDVAKGNPVSFGSDQPSPSIKWFFLHTNQGAGGTGINGDPTAPTVIGAAGQYVVESDQIYVP